MILDLRTRANAHLHRSFNQHIRNHHDQHISTLTRQVHHLHISPATRGHQATLNLRSNTQRPPKLCNNHHTPPALSTNTSIATKQPSTTLRYRRSSNNSNNNNNHKACGKAWRTRNNYSKNACSTIHFGNNNTSNNNNMSKHGKNR